jgi:integrase
MALTDRQCREAKPREKDYKLTDGHGLYLHIMPNGSKYWRYKYRYLKKQRVMALGIYPEVSLAEAREKHRAAHKMVSENKDPSAEKQEEKRQLILNADNTFEAIAREWYEHKRGMWSDNHANTVMRRLEQDLFPVIGRKPIRDITSQMMLDVIRRIEERSAFEIARRATQTSGLIFRYAMLTGRAESNPAEALKGALKPYKKGNYAAMEIKEFPTFLAKLNRNEARVFATTRIMFDLMMLTFVRTSELIKAEWSEFDLKERVWVIPAARMKMRKEHIVPLSKQAIERLNELKRLNGDTKYVFPSQRDPRKHISNNAILVALDRMGYRGIHTGHGFRALAMSTIKEKLGYRHEVVDRQLAHAPGNQVDKAYDRAKFLDERAKMMQEWADYIDKQTKIGLAQ